MVEYDYIDYSYWFPENDLTYFYCYHYYCCFCCCHVIFLSQDDNVVFMEY